MFLRIIVVLFAFAVAATAQPHSSAEPHDVDLCDLIHHAKSYDGQMIRVRGHVIFEFEAFSLDDSACHVGSVRLAKDEKGVWLTFGGDQPEIATFCCGGHNRSKGSDLELAGQKVPLIRDAEFSRFFHQLSAQRLRRPDGKPCGAECKFYEVTATLSGVFAAASAKGGYGHFGMFHLLAISQVSQVHSERRRVPFAGTFACSTETWKPKLEDSALLRDALRCEGSYKDKCSPSSSFGPVAAHWNDDVAGGSTTEGYIDTDSQFIANWVSADLLTSYFTRTTSDGQVSITREHCEPVSPDRGPSPSSVSVACEDYDRSLDEATSREVDALLAKQDFAASWKRTAEGAKLLFVNGDQSWRRGDSKAAAWHVLQEQAQQWHLTPSAELSFDGCQDGSVDDETPALVGCDWYSPDGTQTFRVSLLKSKPAAATQSSPWLVTNVSAQICHPVSD